MEAERVRALVENSIDRMSEELNLGEWTLRVAYHRLDDGCGECEVAPGYLSAHIILDPQQLEDREDVLRTLRHELLHVVAWPMNAAIQAYGPEDTEDANAHFYMERMVAHLERLIAPHLPLEGGGS